MPSTGPPYIDPGVLWELLYIYDLDTEDIEHIEGKRNAIPRPHRVRTEQIVHNESFQEWMILPVSTRILISGNFSGVMLEASALSLFCTTLVNAFRKRENCLCLVWFCGQHLGYSDDSDSDSDFGDSDDGFYPDVDGEGYESGTKVSVIRRMMRSLIAQLVSDYAFGTVCLLPPDIDEAIMEQGCTLEELSRIFCGLVRQLPEHITLFCLLDGIYIYERQEFEDPMLEVLGDILQLTTDRDIPATIKVLVTSPRPTSTVRVGFERNDYDPYTGEKKDLILSLDTLTPAHADFRAERLERNLGNVADETVEA
ncbi:hypothetical protein F5Y17DRAFT_449448 [Xylariaceae sp. FL0594]|nr:hypothetical protein F5Y17DRAFT_449448 [Xylariaceae sp. FL0594]